MIESELLNSMKGTINVSDTELEQLLSASASALDYLLSNNSVVEVPDFGIFTRKTSNQITNNSFKPTDRLKERINQR